MSAGIGRGSGRADWPLGTAAPSEATRSGRLEFRAGGQPLHENATTQSSLQTSQGSAGPSDPSPTRATHRSPSHAPAFRRSCNCEVGWVVHEPDLTPISRRTHQALLQVHRAISLALGVVRC